MRSGRIVEHAGGDYLLASRREHPLMVLAIVRRGVRSIAIVVRHVRSTRRRPIAVAIGMVAGVTRSVGLRRIV